MKRTQTYIFLITLLILVTSSSSSSLKAGEEPGAANFPDQSVKVSSTDEQFFDAGCTVIYGADDDLAFGGNNEDYPDPDTRIWFIPPENGQFGRALVGYEGFIWQGGMNDQGLFFDAMAVENQVQVEPGRKLKYEGSLPAKALAECARVDCVLDLFQEYHAYDTWVFQFMFGDAYGNSVIIEPGEKLFGGSFQVATNFYQSMTDLNRCRYCYRYWTARNMFESADELSVELMRDILNETHLEDDSPTQYSTVYDLKEKDIYLYHFHNYEQVKIFDLEEELAKGYHVYEMENLFPDNLDFMVFAHFEREPLFEAREAYATIDLDPALFEPFKGSYQGPEDLDMAFPYYSVDEKYGDLVLMMMPDKAWLKLEPVTGLDFFHVSYFDQIEISFVKEESGEVNEFIFKEDGDEYLFTRIDVETTDDGGKGSESAMPEFLQKIWKFTDTYTFRFLMIILGLILLQLLLQYLRSLLV